MNARITQNPDDPLDKFRWVEPPHDFGRHDGERVIVCENGNCDWYGTAYASQFAVHAHRHHAEEGA